jgi:hypothetical protein
MTEYREHNAGERRVQLRVELTNRRHRRDRRNRRDLLVTLVDSGDVGGPAIFPITR